MQEQMNKAMSSLSETVGQDVPTLNEVRDKIEARYAKAKGMAELTESSVESRMLEVEQASINSEAQARLAQIRTQLGLSAPADPAQVESGPPTPRPRPTAARARGPDCPAPATATTGEPAAEHEVGVGPHPGPGPTTTGSTPTCWPGATGATWWTATATGGWTPSSRTSTGAASPSTWRWRTGATT